MTRVRSFVERQRATFRHEPVERVVWQPRFSDWYRMNNIHRLKPGMSNEQVASLATRCPDIPEAIHGMEHWEVYAHLNASPRYPGECWPGIGFFHEVPGPDAGIQHHWATDGQGNRVHRITTPHGELQESWRAGSTYPDERILKSRDDFKPALYYLEHSRGQRVFSQDNFNLFRDVNEDAGDICVAVDGPWRSPYNKCIVELAGTMKTMILMKRYTAEFDAFCDELARISFDSIMPPLMASPVDFISCGDNVDCMNNPPYVYEKYILPYFEKVAAECKRAGKFTFAHFDGHLEDLLPYLGSDRYPFDGIEAPTFLPQGDVSLEQFKKALGDGIIVLDGIPSTVFTSYYTSEQFTTMVNDVLEAFAPDLILGVSDEFPPNGLFSRLEAVAGIVDSFSR